MKKELVCFVETNEQEEHVRISRVDDGTNQFMLFTLGQNRMVLNVAELMEAVGAIGHYSVLFDQEQKMRDLRKNAPARPLADELDDEEETITLNDTERDRFVKSLSKVAKEDEGALVLEAQVRSGPTASELALEKQTRLMQGESFVLREQK